MDRVFGILSSPLTLVSLALWACLWCVVAVLGFGLTVFQAVGATSLQILYVALAASAAAWLLRSLQQHRYGYSLIAIGVVLILLQGVVLYEFRFKGWVALGEGEAFRTYTATEAGPWATPVSLPLAFVTVVKDSAECSFALGNQDIRLAKGREVLWQGVRIKMEGLFSAPLLILRDVRGHELEGGYFKLTFEDSQSNYFQFSGLPHRFYLTDPRMPQPSWNWEEKTSRWIETGQGTGDSTYGAPYEKLHVQIVRNKLVIADEDIEEGKPVQFEGHQLVLGEGVLPWAMLEVEKRQGLYALYGGLLLFLAGIVVHIARSRLS